MIFPLSRRARTRLYVVLWVAAGVMLWKVGLRVGPDLASRSWKPGAGFFESAAPAPGLFRFHARLILGAELGFPRQLDGYLPEPGNDLNRRLQLEAMGWWKGKEWTPLAYRYGIAEGHGLHLHLGRLALDDIESVTNARDYNGPVLCQVDYKVRWDVPMDLKTLVLTRSHSGLRLPERLAIEAPGGTQILQSTLERDGLGWKLQDAEALRKRLPGTPGGRGWFILKPLL